jgi:hypothetical protein
MLYGIFFKFVHNCFLNCLIFTNLTKFLEITKSLKHFIFVYIILIYTFMKYLMDTNKLIMVRLSVEYNSKRSTKKNTSNADFKTKLF